MPNNESPDHAGLRSDAGDLIRDDLTWCPLTSGGVHQLRDKVTQFGITAFARGVALQSAELATLRADNAQLQRDLATAATKLASERGTSEVLAEMYYRDPAEAAKILNIMRQLDTLSAFARNEAK